jgi:hypothetical protein
MVVERQQDLIARELPAAAHRLSLRPRGSALGFLTPFFIGDPLICPASGLGLGRDLARPLYPASG